MEQEPNNLTDNRLLGAYVDEHLRSLNDAIKREDVFSGRVYHYKGETVRWGTDITPTQILKMEVEAEVFLFLSEDGQPYSMVTIDSCGNFKEKLITGST